MIFEFSPKEKWALHPSPRDPRDFLYTVDFQRSMELTEVPDRFILDANEPIKDQGPFGTCAGQAMANIKETQENLAQGRTVPMSALFGYTEAKKIDGLPKGTEGTTLIAVLKVAQKLGICEEALHPYSLLRDINLLPEIPFKAYENAQKYKIGPYARVNTRLEIKHAIYTKRSPILGGMWWFDYFRTAPGGILTKPKKGQRVFVDGGHAVSIVGWDDNMTHDGEKGFFKAENSHGKKGDGGYVWLSYELAEMFFELMGEVLMEAWATIPETFVRPKIKKIVAWAGKKEYQVNGVGKEFDVPPKIDTGRILIPGGVTHRELGDVVEWDNATKKITITRGV